MNYPCIPRFVRRILNRLRGVPLVLCALTLGACAGQVEPAPVQCEYLSGAGPNASAVSIWACPVNDAPESERCVIDDRVTTGDDERPVCFVCRVGE